MTVKGRSSDNRGFALLIVLWTMALLAFIIAALTGRSRTEVQIAQNLVANAVAQAAADGAVPEAIYKLSDPSGGGWRLDGRPHVVAIGHSRVRVTITNEAGQINPNLAPEPLLEALLRVTGSTPEAARRLATAIDEWTGRKPTPGGRAAALAEYRAAGRDYGPPGQPLQTIGELSEVLGMTPAVLAAIRPHLTLYGSAQPDPRAADKVVAAALALAAPASGVLPPPTAQPAFPQIVTVKIVAAARGPGNARATTLIVARIGSLLPGGYVILSRKAEFG